MSEKDNSDSFFSRWSDRKLDQKIESEDEVDKAASAFVDEQAVAHQEAKEKPTPIWEQPDVDPEIKKAALRAILRKPEHNILDGLNEYDDDFTQFTGLGNIVTHEMKRVARWVGDELNDNLPAATEVEQQEQAEEPEQTENKEGGDLA
jgi:uncharacterized protein YacL (UPF0231 family)